MPTQRSSTAQLIKRTPHPQNPTPPTRHNSSLARRPSEETCLTRQFFPSRSRGGGNGLVVFFGALDAVSACYLPDPAS